MEFCSLARTDGMSTVPSESVSPMAIVVIQHAGIGDAGIDNSEGVAETVGEVHAIQISDCAVHFRRNLCALSGLHDTTQSPGKPRRDNLPMQS